MESQRIRQKFVDFFVKRGHAHVASSSLIPAQDPTLLFANAGMNQFKDVFLGNEHRAYKRAVTIQKCVRAGGKHNDLENVGFTKRHLTFFEMMGNFSFGDYFKKEAITYAWEFLTKELQLPQEKLHVSIYEEDDESYDIWHEQIGVPHEKIHRLGKKDNFWQMGDVGPCGPCTEIHIDRGPAFGCQEPCGPACDCDRFLEIWNLVFMQYNQQPDGSLQPLAQTGVDTGMGLERLCAVMQNKDSVFLTDLFRPQCLAIERISGKKYEQQSDLLKAAFHVLEDHSRSASMLIADGCMPSNEGRGYVLRKIIRRGALFAQKLTDKSLLPELSQVVIEEMSPFYPALQEQKQLVFDTIKHEVEKFSENLKHGHALLTKYFETHKGDTLVTGEQAFKLYDTFGFPLELIKVMAQERGFSVDLEGFEKEMRKQQERSGALGMDTLDYLKLPSSMQSTFTGYDEIDTETKIVGLIAANHTLADQIDTGNTCWIITEKTPFFVMGGGQSPDQGTLTINGHRVEVLELRLVGGSVAARVKTPVELYIGMPISAHVDGSHRRAIMRNHTATHLLQAALMELFGNAIKQSGSFVATDHLRFDFNCPVNITPEDMNRIELKVNAKIQENIPVCIEILPIEEAKKRGALAFFDEKYTDKVRLVTVPGYSAEFCCGTHVRATGDIGSLKIVELRTVSAGNRRIVAFTGQGAISLFQENFNALRTLSNEYKVPREKIVEVVLAQKNELRDALNALKLVKKDLNIARLPQWEKNIETVNGRQFLFIDIPLADHDDLKELAELLVGRTPAFYVLVSQGTGKAQVVAAVPRSMTDALDLKKFANWLKDTQAIRGGGSQTMIQGAGDKFEANFKDAVKGWLTNL